MILHWYLILRSWATTGTVVSLDSPLVFVGTFTLFVMAVGLVLAAIPKTRYAGWVTLASAAAFFLIWLFTVIAIGGATASG